MTTKDEPVEWLTGCPECGMDGGCDCDSGTWNPPENTNAGKSRSDVEQPAQQQEPEAWMHPDGRIWTFGRGFDKSTFTIPLYTSPPASKPWVGLTDEERRACTQSPFTYENYLAIEAKLKEKNDF